MTTPDDPQYRSYHQPDADEVELRESGGDDGTFRVRMPIATTGEVRNEGDDPLTRDELDGMRTQIEERAIGVFLDHGRNPDVAGSRYSATEKVGEWRDAEMATRDEGADALVADAVMMDPETLPNEAGVIRESLAALKEQVARGFSLSSSIGWREDDSFPGGNDLMEASIVGIGADWRTNSEAADAPTGVLARAALEAGADPESFVDAVRDAVMGPDSEAEHDMTDEETSGSDPDDTTDEEQDGEPDTELDAEEYREKMLEMQETQTELLQSLAEREDDDDGGDDEDDEDEEEEDDEQSADASDGDEEEQSADGKSDDDDDQRDVEEIRSELEDLREQLDDADPADPKEQGEEADEERDADADEQSDEERSEDDVTDPGESLLNEMKDAR